MRVVRSMSIACFFVCSFLAVVAAKNPATKPMLIQTSLVVEVARNLTATKKKDAKTKKASMRSSDRGEGKVKHKRNKKESTIKMKKKPKDRRSLDVSQIFLHPKEALNRPRKPKVMRKKPKVVSKAALPMVGAGSMPKEGPQAALLQPRDLKEKKKKQHGKSIEGGQKKKKKKESKGSKRI